MLNLIAAKMSLIVLALWTMTLMMNTQEASALVPYTRSLFDMMLPAEDPFRILEQTPLTVPKGLEIPLALARADWKETATHHIFLVDVPGLKKDGIKIEIEENRVLRISGERKGEEEIQGEIWHRAERTHGRFWRQFRLPSNADLENVKAHLEDGVLRVVVPKFAEEKRKQAKVVDIVEQEGLDGQDIKADRKA